MSDEHPDLLMERVARGDRAALLALYDRVGPTMLAVAARVTGERAVAEEVVQEVLLAVWREAATFERARGSATAWLLTLSRNRAIDVVRARRRRGAHEERLAAERPEATPTPEAACVDTERSLAVQHALSRLKPEQRVALELSYYSGLSHSEIAAQLEIPLGTIKTRIASAARALRDELARFAPTRAARDLD